MLFPNWKSFFAACADNKTGNKNTSVFTEAWSPKTNDKQRFQMLTSNPNMVNFCRRRKQKAAHLSQLQECRRHAPLPRKQVDAPSGKWSKRNRNQNKLKTTCGKLQPHCFVYPVHPRKHKVRFN
jgi:hypothetical protein